MNAARKEGIGKIIIIKSRTSAVAVEGPPTNELELK